MRQCRDRQYDAAAYVLPQDASLLYFNNPFFGGLLDKVLDNIRVLALPHRGRSCSHATFQGRHPSKHRYADRTGSSSRTAYCSTTSVIA